MPRGRKPKPDRERFENCNYKLPPPIVKKLKKVCLRRSYEQLRKVSEGSVITELIEKLEMPPIPSRSQIAKYVAIRRKAREYRQRYAKPKEP
ncbi:MAG: hypothetical protein SFV32_12510 [Opitutaceae bacterium]|nr:hypothetical protein [Opitutaceae bacterium]